MAQILFSTHATANTGFGHAARCARLAGLLAARRPSLDIALEGAFSDSARARLAAMSGFRLTAPGEPADVAIYDRMDDVQAPEVWDPAHLDDLRRRCRSVLFMANGRRDPEMPAEVTAIGYKPGGPPARPPRLLWGLEFAPVAGDMVPALPMVRQHDSALVALGGAQGSDGLLAVLDAMSRIDALRHVDVIDSPVNPIAAPLPGLRANQSQSVHRGVPSLTPFLASAAVVIASYGHLGYEAMACGAPLCLVGQKPFQADYADRLAERGLCISAGLLADNGPEGLTEAISATLSAGDQLGRAASAAVDGRGLDRIADLILSALGRAAA